MGHSQSHRSLSVNMKYLCILAVLLAVASASQVEEPKSARKPKLFFVSSSSTTSTVNTVTFCYTTSGTITAACKRKKRSILDGFDDNIENIQPSDALDSSMDVVEEPQESNRQGKFLLYWLTTTSTSTTTSFTATKTFTAAGCTPTDFSLVVKMKSASLIVVT